MENLAMLFPGEDYQFQIRFSRASPREFFGPTEARERLLAERRELLGTSPQRYSALLPEGIPLVKEAVELAREWKTLPSDLQDAGEADALNLALGAAWEPDFLLLTIEPAGAVRLVAGCVCFPSSWSLEEKMGKQIESIHGIVPGLNPAIGPQIHSFLAKLKPGVAWLRSNWGLSRSPELNQHPSRNLPRLDETVPIEEVWLRIENQALVALPENKGVLFGIRLAIEPFAEICRDETIAPRLARALRTMPEEMARYKGLERARARLLSFVES
jgi:hypothetical protein